MKRIQRRRTPGYRLPAQAVYVGRPTVFGNPFGGDRREAVRAYRRWVWAGLEGREPATGHLASAVDAQAGYPALRALVKGLPRLRGKDLACFCPLDGGPCHANVLLEVVRSRRFWDLFVDRIVEWTVEEAL